MLWNTSPLHHKTFKQHDLVRFYALTMKANILLACERGDADPNGFGFGAEAGKKKPVGNRGRKSKNSQGMRARPADQKSTEESTVGPNSTERVRAARLRRPLRCSGGRARRAAERMSSSIKWTLMKLNWLVCTDPGSPYSMTRSENGSAKVPMVSREDWVNTSWLSQRTLQSFELWISHST